MWLGVALCTLLSAACVESYDGTRLEANLSVSPGFDRSFLVLPTPDARPGEPGYYSHYELHARLDDGGWVRLRSFLIRPVIQVENPCLQFVEDEFCIDVPGQPCDRWVNMQRYERLEQILGVISVPPTETTDGTGYAHEPGYDFMAWPDRLFVDAGLEEPSAKLSRDNLDPAAVQAFCDELPAAYYVGNGAQLTFPENGKLYGVVDGVDPRTGSTVGGFSLNLPGKLHGLTELLVTRERDPARLSAELRDRRDLLPGPDSRVLLVGQAGGPFGAVERDRYRGVTSVQLESPYALPISMHVIVFEDIDEDPIEL
jgi:hypothetical protein